MKRLSFILLLLFLLLRFDRLASGQGTIVFNNLDPSNGKAFIRTDSGMFSPIQQDLNFELKVFDLGTGPVIFEHHWLLSDGTATGINIGPGLFADPSGSVYVLPGVAPGEARTVSVRAWTGNYNTYFDAINAGASVGATIGAVRAGSIESPPNSLLGLAEFTIVPIPEPSALSLASIGMAMLLIGRKRQT
jgi:hypothetical protein